MKWLWEHIKITLSGILMVISDAVPGFSGGIALTITNKLHEVWGTWEKIKKPEKKGDRKAGIWFYTFFIIGSVGGTFGFAQIIKLMLENIPAITFWFFIAFSVSSIFIYRKVNKKQLYERKEWSKKKHAFKASKWLILGFLFIVGIAAITFFTQGQQHPSDLEPAKQNIAFDNPGLIVLLFFGGFFASAAMVTPGMSGALVLLVFGVYSQLYSGLYGDVAAHPYILILYLAGSILGTLTSVVVLQKLYKKWPFAITWFFYGTVVASIVAMVWIFGPVFIPDQAWRWGVAIPVMFLGFGLALLMMKYVKVK